MEMTGGERRSEQGRFGLESILSSNIALQPDLVEGRVTPVGEQADAICTGEEFIEMILQLCQRQVLVNILSHLKRWRNIECKFRNDTECTQPHHSSMKMFIVLL